MFVIYFAKRGGTKMAERVREIKVEVIVDTNKITYMQTFNITDYESLDDLFEKAKEFTKEVLPK